MRKDLGGTERYPSVNDPIKLGNVPPARAYDTIRLSPKTISYSVLGGFWGAGHLLCTPTRIVTSAVLDFPLDSTARAASVWTPGASSVKVYSNGSW